jgi:hypothetical protein
VRDAGRNTTLQTINRIVQEEAALRPWVTYVDTADLLDGPDHEYVDYFTPEGKPAIRCRRGDGSHLTMDCIALVTDQVLGAIRPMFPVAAPSHPLGRLERLLEPHDVRDEIQIVVSDASGLTKGRDFNVFSLQTWRVSDNATKLLFIRAGLGWGGLPESLVREDVACGRLVRLQLPAFDQRQYPLYVIRSTTNPPGPAARWLTSEIEAAFARLGLS